MIEIPLRFTCYRCGNVAEKHCEAEIRPSLLLKIDMFGKLPDGWWFYFGNVYCDKHKLETIDEHGNKEIVDTEEKK